MADWINHEASWKKSETKEKSTLRSHGLFGIIKKLHHKMFPSKPATVFSGYQTAKMVEGYQREFELQKSKAIAHISRLQTRLI